MTNPPTGWYKNTDGEFQWWDGQQWGILATNYDNVQAAESKPKRSLGCGGWFAVIAAIAVVIVIIGMATNNSASTSRSSDTSGPPAAQNTNPPEPPAEQQLDESMVEQGWAVVDSGDTYFRFFTEEEMANSSCGHWSCTWVVITSVSGCSSGFYVKADILAGETPVSWTNERSASAKPEESVVVMLEDHQDAGDSFRISEISCVG